MLDSNNVFLIYVTNHLILFFKLIEGSVDHTDPLISAQPFPISIAASKHLELLKRLKSSKEYTFVYLKYAVPPTSPYFDLYCYMYVNIFLFAIIRYIYVIKL